jgi:hypothetical protein
MQSQYHPFKTEVFKINNSDIFAINSGKVFNFYNPLNYRNVTCDIYGKPLPKLDFFLNEERKSERNGTIKETSFILKPDYFKVNVHLFASFNPPEKWVPGPSFIPLLDKVWIACKAYLDEEDNSKFEILGNTKNLSESNIKLESFDVNSNFDSSEAFDYLYRDEIYWGGNAMNLAIVASIYKNAEGEWIVEQFLNENYAFTELFDSASFETMNTELYDINVSRTLKDEQIELNETIVGNKIKISIFLGRPSETSLRGYIKHNKNININSNSKQFIFPSEDNKIIESIDNNRYLFDSQLV